MSNEHLKPIDSRDDLTPGRLRNEAFLVRYAGRDHAATVIEWTADRLEALERLLEDLEDIALEGGDTWSLERIAEVLGPLNTRIPR